MIDSSRPRSRRRRSAWTGAATGAALSLAGYAAVFGSRSQLFGSFPFRATTDATHADPAAPRDLALTFDDGPNEPWTSAVLDALAERAVRATFFQVGRCAERHPEVTRRVVDDGHVLGNHSYSHTFSSYLRQPRQREEIRRGRETLAAIAGVAPRLYRPPWLCHPRWVLRSIERSGALPVSGTFVHPLEVFQPSAHRIAAGAVRVARPGAVLIMHDGREGRGGPRSQSAAAVGLLVDRLLDVGYRFVTLDTLFDTPAYA